ncbi:MAG: acyltransferase [Lachnospiraceae bacterium]|jgi:peptidoglycan/LPS O-acetylase OafA/YrhL|nr:acyltransferase [Lachnospiraceae bacterium]
MRKLDYIDGLKGMGALMVYLCHFVFAFYYAAYTLLEEHANTASGIEIRIGRTPLNFFYNGNGAVCLFLVFSGFVLCLSYFRTRDRGRLKAGALKRYFRLIPAILAVNLLIFVFMSLGLYRNAEAAVFTKSIPWLSGFNQFEPKLSGVLYESLIGCFLRGSNDYNGVLWTIPYLFWGALLVYLAAYLVGENKLRYITYGVMLLVSLKTDIYFAGIFLGFVLCDFFSTQERLVKLYRRTPLVPLAVFLLGFYLTSYPSIGTEQPGSVYGCLPAAYAVIYHMAGAFLMTAGALGCDWLQWLFSRRPFLYLGRISYSLYLLHFPVIAVFSCWFFLKLHGILGYGLTVGINFILTTAIVLALSTLSRRYLEPAGSFVEKQVEKRILRKKSKHRGV